MAEFLACSVCQFNIRAPGFRRCLRRPAVSCHGNGSRIHWRHRYGENGAIILSNFQRSLFPFQYTVPFSILPVFVKPFVKCTVVHSTSLL